MGFLVRLLGGFWGWLATRAASFWIAALAGAVIAYGVGYVQNLRVCCAEAKAREQTLTELRDYIDNLTNLAVEGIIREADEDIEAGKAIEDACLDTPLPSELAERLRD